MTFKILKDQLQKDKNLLNILFGKIEQGLPINLIWETYLKVIKKINYTDGILAAVDSTFYGVKEFEDLKKEYVHLKNQLEDIDFHIEYHVRDFLAQDESIAKEIIH